MNATPWCCWLAALLIGAPLVGQEPIFSGPQQGEKLTPFHARGVLGDLAGKDFDLVTQAQGKPLAIIFVHEVSRPAIGLTRAVMDYAVQFKKEGLNLGVIFLDDDLTEAESFLKRASHALPTQVPLGISLDGREGPGAYGLNRHVALTIVIGKENRTTANFALVQPSLQVDALPIAQQIAKVLGHERVPTLADLQLDRNRMAADRKGPADRAEGALEQQLRSLIQKENDESKVRKIATEIEQLIADNEAAKRRLGEITARIVDSGKLENYGVPAAQRQIQQWSERFRQKRDAAPPEADSSSSCIEVR